MQEYDKDHDMKECNGHLKCCSGRGNHGASFRGCPHHAKAELAQKVRDENKVSYATVPEDSILIKKMAFLAFFSKSVWRIKKC